MKQINKSINPINTANTLLEMMKKSQDAGVSIMWGVP